MTNHIYLKAVIVLFVLMSPYCSLSAQNELEEKHISVSMRMIGHQLLLTAQDSSSRVLPIVTIGNEYCIQFESDFGFNPDSLATTVDSIISEAQLASSYLVEVEDCHTGEVVYSYEVGILPKSNLTPCRSRSLPKSCYSIVITLLKRSSPVAMLNARDHQEVKSVLKRNNTDIGYAYLVLPFLFVIGIGAYLRGQQNDSQLNSSVIRIGTFQFNTNNMKLSINGNVEELTSKEADLLMLLFSFVNQTVERQKILEQVWGDEGDYVGRTLDVYISKLRKKLEADPFVSIANVRGVGYRLIVDDLK